MHQNKVIVITIGEYKLFKFLMAIGSFQYRIMPSHVFKVLSIVGAPDVLNMTVLLCDSQVGLLTRPVN